MKRLAILSTIIFSFLYVTAQWEWHNPSPQGNHLLDVQFINENIGWSVGENGTIIHTSDGGAFWEMQNSGTILQLNALSFTDSANGWVVGNAGTILKTNNGGMDWEISTCGISKKLNDCYFINSDTGWVVCDAGFILYTYNSGSDWVQQNSGTTSSLNSICFVDSENSWIAGHRKILHTSDGGNSWMEQLEVDCKFNSICFTDLSNGWAVSDEGATYHTSDGGVNWKKLSYLSNMELSYCTTILFRDTLNGWIAGTGTPAMSPSHGSIWQTKDGGYTWSWHSFESGICFNSLYAIDDNICWTVGTNGKVYYTNTNGEEWLRLDAGTNEMLFDIFFINKNQGWAVGGENGFVSYSRGEGIILHTNNGGENWNIQLDEEHTMPKTSLFHSVYFADSLTGWAVGGIEFTQEYSHNHIRLTKDGGLNWHIPNSIDTAGLLLSAFASNKQSVWAVGRYGIILNSNNGGDDWHRIESNTENHLNSLQFINQYGWINGGDIILHTEDEGLNWTQYEIETENPLIETYYSDEKNGLGGTENGEIYTTSDGGVSWDLITQAAYNVTSYCFNTNGVILAKGYEQVSGQGNILLIYDISDDEWSEIITPTQNTINKIYYHENNKVWLAGNGGGLLSTSSGGMTWIPDHDNISNITILNSYPNPFSKTTAIEYELTQPERVKITFYNQFGMLVDRLEQTQSEGAQQIVWTPDLPGGVYYFRMEAGKYSATGKLVLMK